jgi:hypothetical protein
MAAQPAGTQLAQFNVARLQFPADDPRVAEFMSGIDRINALADRSPGFVWRLKDDSGTSLDIKVNDDPQLLVNMSVWETPAHLEQFVWNTVHKRFYRKKGNWFEPAKAPQFVMWWIEAGRVPTVEEGVARLDHLTVNGPSDHAFGWESLPNVTLWMQQRCA